MSAIELERLIARQTYFIPIESSKLETAILNELRASDPEIDGVYPWNLLEEHKLSFHFGYDIKYAFLFAHIWGLTKKTRKFKKIVKEKSEEFDDLGVEAFYRQLKTFLPNLPMEVFVSIKKKEKDGCLCKVECLPSLYNKLRFLKDTKTNDLQMQDAHLTCKRFLENIFESGLSATLVVEEKKKLLKPSTQLLINDQTSRQILNRIEKMLDAATGEVLFCGWIGTFCSLN